MFWKIFFAVTVWLGVIILIDDTDWELILRFELMILSTTLLLLYVFISSDGLYKFFKRGSDE